MDHTEQTNTLRSDTAVFELLVLSVADTCEITMLTCLGLYYAAK